MENEITLERQKQPKALYFLALTASLERFSYYGMRAFLILYMTSAVNDKLGGMGWTEGMSGRVYAWFTGLCYLFPLFGGIISDMLIGERRSVLIGGLLIMLGHFTCAIDNGIAPFAIGLSLLVLGNGFFKPTVVTMVGDLYQQGDKRRDSAFTIYYMLFNAGAFAAPILCGFLGENYGYRYGFIAAGTGMAIGLSMYMITAQKALGNLGKIPKRLKYKQEVHAEKTPLTKEEVDRIAVIIVLMLFVIFFWASFEQAGSSFNIYTKNYINRNVLGWTIPTTWFQSVNPLMVVALSPIFSWLWIYLARRKKNPPTPVKMAIGMLFLGIGFLFMVGAVMQRGGDIADTTVKASLLWILGTYLFHTIGELCISPIGLSMVTKLAPMKLASLFMGVWFTSMFLANLISGYLVGYVKVMGAGTIFGGIAVFMVVLGIIVFFVSRKLVVMMHGRD